jgi:hypothetical protein
MGGRKRGWGGGGGTDEAVELVEYGDHVDGFFAVGYAVYFLVVGFRQLILGRVFNLHITARILLFVRK